MRAARVLVLCAIFGLALSEETECKCPDLVKALSSGMDVFASEGPGTVNLPPCCEDILKYKAQIAAGGFQSKHTPGGACSALTSCASCTVLAFCRWHVGSDGVLKSSHRAPNANATPPEAGSAPKYFGALGCVDASSIDELDVGEYTHQCKMNDRFTAAELRKDMNNPSRVFVQKISDLDKNQTFTDSPRIAYLPADWPVANFEGYLPPAGCGGSLSAAEIAEKYPSGLPGCGDYVNEGTSEKEGHMTTDIVSDPRLPVETHKPGFPLGANSQLPDRNADHGGDWDLKQPLSAWIQPHYNHNGCVGGPCDDISQHSCTGLSCSHVVNEGTEVHDERAGSMYKHPPKESKEE